MRKQKAVFLDRDGTLIRDSGYLKDGSAVGLLDRVGETLARIKKYNFVLVLVSNQSGIGRGLISPEEARVVHEACVGQLADHGIHLDAIDYCPHAPEKRCACRKPSPGMILRAAVELHIDLPRSFLVGDRTTDMEAGQRAGCRSILLVDEASAIETEPKEKFRRACTWTEVLRQIESMMTLTE